MTIKTVDTVLLQYKDPAVRNELVATAKEINRYLPVSEYRDVRVIFPILKQIVIKALMVACLKYRSLAGKNAKRK